jgi:hypothetical protein
MVPGGDLHDSPCGARRGWRGHKASKRAYGSRGHRLAPVLCNSRFVGGATMATYRICTVGSDGSLVAGEDIECADDQEAIEKASQAAKVTASSYGNVIAVSSNCCLLRARIGIFPP